MQKIFLISLLLIAVSGCASITSIPKNILGVSTKNLDNARSNSIYQVYQADYFDAYKAVLDAAKKSGYYVFLNDEVRGVIVLMNIPGCVDTTEVGVYVSRLAKDQGVKIELSSRSTPAKRIVAKVLFEILKESLNQK